MSSSSLSLSLGRYIFISPISSLLQYFLYNLLDYEDGINRGGVIVYEYTDRNGSSPTWINMGQRINGEARGMSGSSVGMSSNGMRITNGAPASVGENGKLQAGSTQVFGWCSI